MMCRIFGRDSPGKHSNASRIRRAIRVDLELTWQYPLREFCPKQKICLCKSSSLFTIYIYMDLYDSRYDSVIRVALNATSRVTIYRFILEHSLQD